MFSHGANISSLSGFCHHHGNSYELLVEMSFSHGWMADFMGQRLKPNWAKHSRKMRIRSKNGKIWNDCEDKRKSFLFSSICQFFRCQATLFLAQGSPPKRGSRQVWYFFVGKNSPLPLWQMRKCHEVHHMWKISWQCPFAYFYTIQSLAT